MKCHICRTGNTNAGKATVVLQRGETTIIVKGVPAQVCENCGEYYLSPTITRKVLARAEKAVASGVEVEIIKFAA